jgi:hypothetical protein
MNSYIIEVTTTGHEVYTIYASSEEEVKLTLPQRWNGLVRTLIVKDVELKEARLEEEWGQ